MYLSLFYKKHNLVHLHIPNSRALSRGNAHQLENETGMPRTPPPLDLHLVLPKRLPKHRRTGAALRHNDYTDRPWRVHRCRVSTTYTIERRK